MNILVTGGAGYIGSITTEALIARGHRAVVLDSLEKGHRQAVHPEAAFVEGNFADRAIVREALREHEVEAVLHFAAYSLVGDSMQQPLAYFRNNSAATVALLEAMAEEGVQKFVLSSTAALFGTPDRLPIAESDAIRPESVYGESKHLTERMLKWLARTTGLGYATLRYFNAAGASERYGEDHRPETHLIPLLLDVAQGKRERIQVFGDDYDTPDGSNVRDYIHVCDLAEAHLLAVEALSPGEERAYNLGNGKGFSVFEVIETCRRVTGHPVPVVVSGRRAGDPATLVADSGLIARELGWRPEHPDLEAIVASAWEWRLRHPHGYEE